jgi:ABC-type bacteriocin/lantibiotic exporter with double-glycine peptidase domain
LETSGWHQLCLIQLTVAVFLFEIVPLVGGWSAYAQRLEIGGVVAFISRIGRITDPWGDIVNYFRDINITQVKFALVRGRSLGIRHRIWF